MTFIPYQTSDIAPPGDRRTQLLVMGILLLVAAGCCALIGLSFGLLMQLRPPGTPTTPARQVVMSILIYAVATVMFAAMGGGSILRRRWTRPVVLAVAWPWVIVGLFATFAVGFAIVRVVRAMPGPRPGMSVPLPGAIIAVVTAMVGLIYIGLPALLILMYKGMEVQSTLEFYDPHRRWTDGVPIRVLSLCLIMLASAVTMLGNGLMGFAPVFGLLLRGPVAIGVMVVVAGICLLDVWWCYRLQMRGWLLATTLIILMPISAALTFWRMPMIELYRSMGMSDADIKMAQKMGTMQSTGQMTIWVASGAALGIGYALATRSCFTNRGEADEATSLQPA